MQILVSMLHSFQRFHVFPAFSQERLDYVVAFWLGTFFPVKAQGRGQVLVMKRDGLSRQSFTRPLD